MASLLGCEYLELFERQVSYIGPFPQTCADPLETSMTAMAAVQRILTRQQKPQTAGSTDPLNIEAQLIQYVLQYVAGTSLLLSITTSCRESGIPRQLDLF